MWRYSQEPAQRGPYPPTLQVLASLVAGLRGLSDLRLLLNQPPRKLGGSCIFFGGGAVSDGEKSGSQLQHCLPARDVRFVFRPPAKLQVRGGHDG
jgi:hypothetical protein